MDEYFSTDLYLNGGAGDYGFYELPYYEPVYYEPVYEPAPAPIPEPVYYEPEPVYYELPPPPVVYEPPPVYIPEPVYEPTYEVALYQEPVSYYQAPEPIYYELPYIEPEPVYVAPAPVYQPAPEPIYQAPEPVYTEPVYFIEQAPTIEQSFYTEPEPIAEPVYFELPYIEPAPESVFEPEPIYFELPVGPEPEPIAFVEPVYEPFPIAEPIIEEAFYAEPYFAEPKAEQFLFLEQEQPAPEYEPAPIYEPAFVFEPIAYEPIPEPIYYPEPTVWPEPVYVEPKPIESSLWEGTLPSGEQIGTPEWPVVIESFEPVTVGIDKTMYTDDFGNSIESGVYLDGGGGDSFAVDYASYYEPIDYAPEFELLPVFEPEPFMPPLVSEDLPFAPYEPIPVESLEPPVFEPVPTFEEYYGLPFEGFEPEPLPFEPLPGEFETEPLLPTAPDPFFEYLDNYLAIGYDVDTAIALAEQDRAAETVVMPPTEAPLPLPDLPPMAFPYVPSPFDPWMTPPYIEFPEGPYFPLPPPPEKLGPCDTPTGLPGVCAQGFYHPLDNPCACVPFPPARPPTTPTTPPPQAPRPPAPQAPRPPAQPQACPTTHCKHPTTGQCIPIPQGYARHPQTQVCTPLTAQVSPLPIPTEAKDLFENLKELPWWVWVAGAGLLLLSQSGGGERRTTITHRRSS